MRLNPFQPNNPINPYCFHGRAYELQKIEKILYQAKFNKTANFLITGERGIGKSSLLLYVNYLASGKIEGIDGNKFNYLTIQINLDKNTTLFQLAKKLNFEINRKIQKDDALKKTLGEIWKYVKNLEIKGIKYNEKIPTDEDLMDDLASSMVDTAKTISDNKKYNGILILIDEADNAEKASLGTFFKNLSEKLVIESCQNIVLGLSGLPKIKTNLYNDHPSSLRIFDVIELRPLDKTDVLSIVQSAMETARKENVGTFVADDDAQQTIFAYSEGYPHFVQQIGFSSFDLLDSNASQLTKELVDTAMFSKDGALEKIGLRYYHDFFWNKIQKDEYREVLKIIAELRHNEWVKKSEIAKKFEGSASVLTNALGALTDRSIIIKDPSIKGMYRLQWLGFAIWIKYCANKKPF